MIACQMTDSPPYTDKPKAPQYQDNKLIKPKFPNKPSYKPG